MVEILTSLSWLKKGRSRSLRTTVPIEIVKLLGLSNKDKLVWKYSIGSTVITVEKKSNQ